MLNDVIGPPQIAALLLLLQRGAEELYSARNTRALLAAGGFEIGRDYYPVVAVTHLAWIFIDLLPDPRRIPRDHMAAAGAVPLLLQVVRYWVIGTLGRYWTHRIITLDKGAGRKGGGVDIAGSEASDLYRHQR